ncbi:MAG: hypothetical protein LBE12_03290, partial [Planctomycetaceae bacterium]|nr:hypothetical protein [Planctomycetaceae bacterium]
VDNVNFWSQTQKRIRQNNAYENNDILIKWQNDNFFFKFAWKSIERYVPNALNIIGYGPYEFADGPFIVPFNLSRKQNIISRSFTAGYRNQISNLEWGISANYNEESKAYAFQNISQLQLSQTLTSWSAALKIWSRYESKRFGFQLDGEYKLGNRNLLEFLVNYSHEKLEIYGNGMRDEMKFVPDNVTYRPEFQQTLFNVQLQDTITLDNNESFFLTASVKYNLSRIFGARPLEHSHVSSTNQDIYQTNSKYTWQVALKKTFGDTFALRATYGTYYRLLNLYEIAGDGVGILPQTSTDTGTRGQQLFPEPEEGKQWDISAMFHTRWFNSDTNITLTYYGRSSKKILHLFKMAYNYMSYSNAISGKVTGLELEASIAWEKFDILMSGTLQNTRMKRRDMNWGSDRLTYPVNLPYTPEKQAYVRMNIRPIKELSLFAELNYTGEMPTSYNQDNHDFLEKITTVGFGAKATLPYGFELVVGVRDFFNKEPKQRVFSKTYYTADPIAFADFNADYPGQGRTIYVTLTYSY